MAVIPAATRRTLIPFTATRPLLETAVSTTQQLSLLLWPHGLQHGARRNAHRALIADEASAKHRRAMHADVEAAIASTESAFARLVSVPREYAAPTG